MQMSRKYSWMWYESFFVPSRSVATRAPHEAALVAARPCTHDAIPAARTRFWHRDCCSRTLEPRAPRLSPAEVQVSPGGLAHAFFSFRTGDGGA